MFYWYWLDSICQWPLSSHQRATFCPQLRNCAFYKIAPAYTQWHIIKRARQLNHQTPRLVKKFGVRCIVIGINTEIELRVASPVTRQSHHTSRRSWDVWWDCRVTGDATLTENRCISILSWCHKAYKCMQIRVCKSRKLLRIGHYRKHGSRPLSQQPPWLCFSGHCDVTEMHVSLNLDNMPQWKPANIRYLCRI